MACRAHHNQLNLFLTTYFNGDSTPVELVFRERERQVDKHNHPLTHSPMVFHKTCVTNGRLFSLSGTDNAARQQVNVEQTERLHCFWENAKFVKVQNVCEVSVIHVYLSVQ